MDTTVQILFGSLGPTVVETPQDTRRPVRHSTLFLGGASTQNLLGGATTVSTSHVNLSFLGPRFGTPDPEPKMGTLQAPSQKRGSVHWWSALHPPNFVVFK